MSLETTAVSITYTGNNSTVTPYPIPFAFLDVAHIQVTVTDADDVVTVLEAADFTVTRFESGLGELVTTDAFDNTNELKVERVTPTTQPIVLQDGALIPAKTLERGLDRLAMIGQEIKAEQESDEAPLHAETHVAGGTDPVTLTQAQITGLVAALAAKEPTQTAAGQVEAEAGLVEAIRSWSPLRVAQAIAALTPAQAWGDITGTLSAQSDLQSALDTKLDAALALDDSADAGKIPKIAAGPLLYLPRFVRFIPSGGTGSFATMNNDSGEFHIHFVRANGAAALTLRWPDVSALASSCFLDIPAAALAGDSTLALLSDIAATASQAEAEAGSDNTKAMTPLRTAQAIAALGSGGGASFVTGMEMDYAGTTAPTGWVRLNGSSIGSAGSGATERANADTETLYSLFWDNYADAQCAVAGGRGASAVADFAADKALTLPDARGRVAVPVLAGTFATIGDASLGAETHTLTEGELAAHTHTGPSHSHALEADENFIKQDAVSDALSLAPAVAVEGGGTSGGNTASGGTGNTGSAGSGTAHNNIQPTRVTGCRIIKL